MSTENSVKSKSLLIPKEEEEDSFRKLPSNDILSNHDETDDRGQKFDFLKGKYVFRFPFTLTAMKWGFAMGSFFAIHTYIKKRNISNSLYWFGVGTIMTGMPIW